MLNIKLSLEINNPITPKTPVTSAAQEKPNNRNPSQATVQEIVASVEEENKTDADLEEDLIVDITISEQPTAAEFSIQTQRFCPCGISLTLCCTLRVAL